MEDGVIDCRPAKREEDELWDWFRQSRSAYVTACRVLVSRGLLAEMPGDMEKPIKVR